jgi:hypothetical protein
MTYQKTHVFSHFRGAAGQGDTSPLDSVNRVNFFTKAGSKLNESPPHG